MRKLLLTIFAAGTVLWSASAGAIRILDAAPAAAVRRSGSSRCCTGWKRVP